MPQTLKLFLLVCLPAALVAGPILTGSDGSGPVQLLANNGSTIGTIGQTDGTAAASNGLGGFFVATPGDTSSTINVYDSSRTLVNSFAFTPTADTRASAGYITDLSWGSAGSLWVSTYSGEVYHLSGAGSVLSSFDTSVTAPGVAFDGSSLYTSTGPGFASPNPFLDQRDASGSILKTINTGLNDTLGLGYDPVSNTLWVGGIDALTQVSLTGAILQSFAVDGTHYGVDVALAPPVTSIPEPSTWSLLLASGLLVLLCNRKLRTCAVRGVVAAAMCATPLLHANVTISSVTPNPATSAPVGTSITIHVAASDPDAGPLRYRYQWRPAGAATWNLLSDFSSSNSFVWTPSDTDGSFEIEVAVRNRTTNNMQLQVLPYTVSSRVTGSSPVVNPTKHSLVAFYSAPACAAGSSMRVRFKLPSDVYWQGTPLKACNGTSSMNFYIAGMRANSTYQLRDDLIRGPHITSGPTLTFTTGALPAGLPTPSAIKPMVAPTSLTEGVLIFSTHPVYAVDSSLNIIWYQTFSDNDAPRMVPGGDILIDYGSPANPDHSTTGLREYDLAGNIVKETNAERMSDQLVAKGQDPINGWDHEIRKLADGRYLGLCSTEILSSAQGPPDDILGNTIVVMDDNLQLQWSWDSFKHLNVNKKAVLDEICTPGPACAINKNPTAHDWLHGNSVALTPDGNLIYSARHQDTGYKIAFQNGAGDGHVIWRLGKDGDFTMLSSDPLYNYPWFSHQHDIEFDDPTTISLFDDGNTRVQTVGFGNSRGQVLHIDVISRTVSLLLNVDLGGYSAFLGSAQRLLNGNHVFGNGAIQPDLNAQVSEWTSSGVEVSNIGSTGTAYRAFRYRDLYSAPF